MVAASTRSGGSVREFKRRWSMARPSFRVKEEDRKLVRSMAALGLRQDQIAETVGLRSPKTLRKHFRRQLDAGLAEATLMVARVAHKMATSGRNPGATMYWLKTRAGWSEKGKAPEPVEPRPEKCTWVVTVHQPPRPPEEEQQLREAVQAFGGATPEWEEWEDGGQPTV